MLHIWALYKCIVYSKLYVYILPYKVNVLLILFMLCSTDLFIDWGNSSNNLSDYIIKLGETQLPVVSRTSLVNLVTGLKFKLVIFNSVTV